MRQIVYSCRPRARGLEGSPSPPQSRCLRSRRSRRAPSWSWRAGPPRRCTSSTARPRRRFAYLQSSARGRRKPQSRHRRRPGDRDEADGPGRAALRRAPRRATTGDPPPPTGRRRAVNKTIYVRSIQFLMPTAVYSIRLDSDIRRMMKEMSEVNWQADIRMMVETMVRERNKMKLLARAEARWKEQVPNEKGASAMIREDRNAR